MDFRVWMLPLMAGLGFVVYDWNLQAQYAYEGMTPIATDLGWWVVFVVWSMLAATILPRRIRLPSDMFLLFYTVACFIWGSALWGATGLLSVEGAIVLMLLLYLPAFAIRAAQRFALPVAGRFVLPVRWFSRSHLYVPLSLLLALGAAAAMSTLGSGDFGLDTVYVRRLAGREALDGQAFAGYAINMTINGIVPLLAFMAGWRRSPLLFAIAGAFVLLMFWLLGLKSPFLNVFVLGGLGFLMRERRLEGWLIPLMLATLIVFFAYVVRDVAVSEYSTLADYVVRRVAMVQPQVQSYYVDHWLGLDWWHRVFGAPLETYSDWTFLIGHKYLHNPESNANVNGFIYALVRGGLAGYMLAVAAVLAFCVAVDAMFENSAAIEFVGLAGLYGVLVSEQAYTTALVSSGVLLCLAFIILFSYPSRRQPDILHAKAN